MIGEESPFPPHRQPERDSRVFIEVGIHTRNPGKNPREVGGFLA